VASRRGVTLPGTAGPGHGRLSPPAWSRRALGRPRKLTVSRGRATAPISAREALDPLVAAARRGAAGTPPNFLSHSYSRRLPALG
jgi:hypothetical protein